MTAYQNIKTETKGRVGIIRLDRPKALNALCADLVRELGQALDAFGRSRRMIPTRPLVSVLMF